MLFIQFEPALFKSVLSCKGEEIFSKLHLYDAVVDFPDHADAFAFDAHPRADLCPVGKHVLRLLFFFMFLSLHFGILENLERLVKHTHDYKLVRRVRERVVRLVVTAVAAEKSVDRLHAAAVARPTRP